jgi:type IV pilus assembly protein PilW
VRTFSRRQAGLSLIELMIALLIGSILLIGVIQVFMASRSAYQLSQGLGRAQENGRFAIDYLQRDIRMVGHFGCVNDQARLQSPGALTTHMLTTDNPFNFNISVQGYEANGTQPTGSVNLAAPAGGWSPALPTYISGLNPAPLPGSDIIVLRFFYPTGAPVTALTATTVQVDSSHWDALTREGVQTPAIFGVSDCAWADVFQASAVSSGLVTTSASGGVRTSLPDFQGHYTQSPAGQTTLYRAESVVYYVGAGGGAGGRPSLWRARFNTPINGANPVANMEEVVAGIQNMQLIYGQDQSTNVASLTGNIVNFNPASTLGAAVANENAWRRVGQVKVAVLAESPDPALAATPVSALSALGVTYTLPADSRYRSVYESSIALRNRLYGN